MQLVAQILPLEFAGFSWFRWCLKWGPPVWVTPPL